jgi:putative metallohydrolase (TIGR04338 family)
MSEGKKRDSQRQKLYNAEGEAIHASKNRINFDSITEIQTYVDKIVASAWWKSRFDIRQIFVTDGRRRRSAAGIRHFDLTGTIKMPKFSRNNWITLHEMAHCVSHDDHGRGYAKNYLLLVKRFISDVDYKILKAAFVKYRVKHTAKKNIKVKRVVPEHVIQALADARAARAAAKTRESIKE